MPKDKHTIETIISTIKETHPKSSGLIYCYSRDETEKVAQSLQDSHISCRPYHAGMESEERSQIQEDWQNDKVKVIVAT